VSVVREEEPFAVTREGWYLPLGMSTASSAIRRTSSRLRAVTPGHRICGAARAVLGSIVPASSRYRLNAAVSAARATATCSRTAGQGVGSGAT